MQTKDKRAAKSRITILRNSSDSSRLFSDFEHRHFWRWTEFSSYLQFLLTFTLASGAVTYLLLDSVIYVETLGFLAVLFEALLGVPQFYRNYHNKSTQGMRYVENLLAIELKIENSTALKESASMWMFHGAVTVCFSQKVFLLPVYKWWSCGRQETSSKPCIFW